MHLHFKYNLSKSNLIHYFASPLESSILVLSNTELVTRDKPCSSVLIVEVD